MFSKTPMVAVIVPLLENDVHCCVLLAVLGQKRATIDNAPAHFRSLLRLFGAETAIESLIKAVGLGQ